MSDVPVPTIDVVAVESASGATVLRNRLAHGEDPHELLADAGWLVQRILDIQSSSAGTHHLSFSFLVTAAESSGHALARGASLTVPRDAPLGIADGEVPVVRQRVAAYALVTSPRGVLLTQFSDRTNAPGTWGLPGGGIDPGEHPRDAVVRETWEETGQQISVPALAGVRTSHWVGRAPNGLLEDFHAVRVLFRGTCEEPGRPVVHDVGGTTESAAWVDPAALTAYPMTAAWRETLDALRMPAAPPSG